MYCVKADGTDETAAKIKGYFMDEKAKDIQTHSFLTHLYYWVDENNYIRCQKYYPNTFEIKEL